MLIETHANTFLIPVDNSFLTLTKACDEKWIICAGEAKSVRNIRVGKYFEKQFTSLMEVESEYPKLKGIEILINLPLTSEVYH